MIPSMTVAESSTCARDLFGGAIVCNIPESYEDISIYRTVPDHQEVYVDKLSNSTVIVEILSQEDISDENAPDYFFQDLAEFNKAQKFEVFFKQSIPTSSCAPSLNGSYTRSMLIGKMEVEKDHQVDHVLVLMLVLRLTDISTDIMITLNAVDGSPSVQQLTSQGVVADPSTLFMADSTTQTMTRAEEAFHDAISSFRIDDWTLFG